MWDEKLPIVIFISMSRENNIHLSHNGNENEGKHMNQSYLKISSREYLILNSTFSKIASHMLKQTHSYYT